MLAKSGEATPPWGVPTRVGWNLPSSITPALRNFSTIRKMFPSATTSDNSRIMARWERLSKKPDISASSTQRYPCRPSSKTFSTA